MKISEKAWLKVSWLLLSFLPILLQALAVKSAKVRKSRLWTIYTKTGGFIPTLVELG